MKFIFLTCILGLLSFVSSDSDFSIMEPNSIAILVTGTNDLNVLTPEKCFISVGAEMSKLKVKGPEASLQFKTGTEFTIYARRVENDKIFTFAIVKLERSEKKRSTSYNAYLNNKISTVAHSAKEVDSKLKIMQINPKSRLEAGSYALVFKQVINDNFSFLGNYRHNTCFFDIIE